jgi:hypothetical protein
MADVIRRGVRVLVDKDALLARVLPLPMPQEPPTRCPWKLRF